MIVSLHVATGAAGGGAARSRPLAITLGLLLHLVGDLVPHQDIRSRRFEILSGAGTLLALAFVKGPLHPVTIGAAAASSPDLEHVLPLPRPRGRKLFPSHRVSGWHRAGGLPAWTQLLAAGVLLGLMLGSRR